MGDEGYVIFAGDDGGDEGVVADEMHAEAGGAAGDLEADTAEAYDAEGLAAELGALQGFFVPLGLMHGGVGAGDGASEGDHEAEGEFGYGYYGVGSGVFMTTMPRWVAASVSMLSTPTPARPMTRSLGADSRSLASAWTAERRRGRRRRLVPRRDRFNLIGGDDFPAGLLLEDGEGSGRDFFGENDLQG